jgi:hypothetical protein
MTAPTTASNRATSGERAGPYARFLKFKVTGTLFSEAVPTVRNIVVALLISKAIAAA